MILSKNYYLTDNTEMNDKNEQRKVTYRIKVNE